MQRKWKVGVLGATGMVGQRFVSLLAEHPWFEITVVAASPQSAGKSYAAAVGGRWALESAVPSPVANLIVKDASDIGAVGCEVDFVFSAVDMTKEQILSLEEAYARAGIPVVSNNSAHRGTPDVPVVIPEINADHLRVIDAQRRRFGSKGFIVAKPNCSLQSYQPALHPLLSFGIKSVAVCTYQAISGAGKTFQTWPEMLDNVIPFIKGEEDKSENEPLKIWGAVRGDVIVPAIEPSISAQCIRVPVSDGHLAAVFVSFVKKPSREEILRCWQEFRGRPQELRLPSAPAQMLTYFEEDSRPQTKLDRNLFAGMGVGVGRLREDHMFDYKFVALSHNTIRGAAGGAILTAELLAAEGYFDK